MSWEGPGRVSHVHWLPCGGGQGCPAAGARGCQGTDAVPLLPVSQSGALSSFPLQEMKTYSKEQRGTGVGRRTRFAEPCCSSDLFKPLFFPLS